MINMFYLNLIWFEGGLYYIHKKKIAIHFIHMNILINNINLYKVKEIIYDLIL